MIDSRFDELEKRAMAALRIPHPFQGAPRIGHRSLILQLWNHQTWGPWRSWTVYSRGNDSTALVRRVAWEQLVDRAGMNDPLEVARRLGSPEPTLEVRDVFLEGSIVDEWRDNLARIRIPLIQDKTVTLDGVTSGVRDPGEIELQWRNDGPAEWKELIHFHSEVVDQCERLFG